MKAAAAATADPPGHGEAGARPPGPLADVLEALNEGVWIVEPGGLTVVEVNEAALSLLGLAREAVLGRPAAALLATPEDQAFWRDAAAGSRVLLHSEVRSVRGDGAPLLLTRRIGRMRDGCWLVAVRDQTAQRRSEGEREALLGELRATLEATADGLLVTDLHGRIRAFNRRFAELWELPATLCEQRDDEAVFEWMRRRVVDAAAYRQRLAVITRDNPATAHDRLLLAGGRIVERVGQPLLVKGRAAGRVWSFRDLSEREAARRRIDDLTRKDALTGLPNRRSLAEAIGAAIARSRAQGHGFALLLLDLDRFKHINDSLGHDVGDQVLGETARRVAACLREGDRVARLGADQFVVLLDGADARGAELAARRVLDAVARPHGPGEGPFTVTCSIGIALHPADADDAETLLGQAETAMQQAKQGGRAGFRFHRGGDDSAALRQRLELDHAMRQALARGGFELHYQPQVDLADGRVRGVEALIRWHDPERGTVPPGRFIPVAEETGLIVAVGDWVLETAVRQGAAWQAQGRALTVAVNVSALQFQQPDFVERVGRALAEHGLEAASLELELTESILLRDADEALARLRALATLGVQLSIDDFGTGYSSLAYLKRFPLGRLKIDRSFVSGLPADDSDAAIVRAIVQMARALGLRVIAEGVETPAQRQFLHASGCDEFQGFLCTPALAPSALAEHLGWGP